MASATLRNLSRMLAALLLVSAASSQLTTPQTNAPTIDNDDQFVMDTVINGMPVHPPLAPLTDQAGRAGSADQKQKIQITGPLYLTTADTVGELRAGAIAYTSCEPGDYTGDLGSTGVMNRAVNQQAAAIVLYSVNAASCSFQPTNNFDFGPVYTMLAANISEGVARGLNSSDQSPKAGIHLNQDASNSTSGGSSGGSVLGKSPTTAVAMIILYSITGIITALFLIIIVVGAIRAHRHPERYGPRHVVGRPRQSRAKGIARAMLDTLPVVKFGDREEDKPAETNRDLEMAPPSDATDRRNSSEATVNDASREASASNEAAAVKTETVQEGEQSKDSKKPSANPIDDGLACSVCTDDFVRGQDIRLLPCKHKFHPECIDPWLLNVSGTCPLCRIDLHPATGSDEEQRDPHVPTLDVQEADPTPGAEAGESNAETGRQNRRSRILSTLNVGRMRHATPQERLEALRSLRNDRSTDESARTRFSRRLSRALGSRPVSEVHSRPVSGVPPVASGALPSTDETAPQQDTPPETADRTRMGSFAG